MPSGICRIDVPQAEREGMSETYVTQLDAPAAPTGQNSTIRSRWPGLVGYATAIWSLIYGLLGLYWTFGGAGFPFGVEHDPLAAKISILERGQPDTAGPVIAVLGLAGAAFAVLIARRRTWGPAGAALVGFAWTMAAGLAVVIPDYRPLLAVVRAPMFAVGAPLGLTQGVSLADFFPAFLPWPVVNQILMMAGGALWAASAVAYRRRVRDACGNCGRTETSSGWSTPAQAARWGRWAVHIAILVPVLYALTRWAWALNIPFGLSREGLEKEARESPGIWWAGAMLATMAVGGAILTRGLVRPWGEVYPRWIPFLRGKRVRPRTAIIPASLVAILVTSAGLMYLRAFALGYVSVDDQSWGTVVPEFFWPLWGVALAAATLAYHIRRRGQCRYCHRS
jgi:hypothetical protein